MQPAVLATGARVDAPFLSFKCCGSTKQHSLFFNFRVSCSHVRMISFAEVLDPDFVAIMNYTFIHR